jgi:hypothetical protein
LRRAALKPINGSSMLTKVLRYVNYTKVFVDPPVAGQPPAKHFYLQSLQSAGGRGSVAHMLVRYQLHGNKYIDLDSPNVGLMVSAGSDQIVSVRVLPLTLVRGNHTQEFEVLLDVGDIDARRPRRRPRAQRRHCAVHGERRANVGADATHSGVWQRHSDCGARHHADADPRRRGDTR